MAVAKELVRGMLISVCYCLVFLMLWRFPLTSGTCQLDCGLSLCFIDLIESGRFCW